MVIFYVVSSIVAAVACILLGLWVVLNNPKGSINRSFFATFFCLALWISWDAMVASRRLEADFGLLLFVGKALHIFIILMPAAVVWWGQSTVEKERDKVVLPALAVVSGILVVLNLTTSLILKGLVFKPVKGSTILTVEYGSLYNVFYAVFAFSLAYATWLFVQCYRKSGSYKRNQIRYLILAISIGFLVATPVYFLNAVGMKILPVDNLVLILVCASIAYGIIRYRSMDIKVVIKKGIIYTATLALVVGGYVLLVVITQTIFHRLMGFPEVPPLMLTAIAALTIAIAFEPVKEKVAGLVNKAFYKGGYDYQQTLRKFSKVVAATLSLDSLTRFVVSTVKETMQAENVSLFLLDESRGEYSEAAAVGRDRKIPGAVGLKEDSAIVSRLSSGETFIIKEGIEQFYSRAEAEKIKRECELIHGEVVLSMFSQGKLKGVLGLGNRLSGDIYSQQDLEILATILNQTAVAIQNARLYGEVVAGRDYSENVLQNLTSAVITVDSQGKVTAFNHLAERMIGLRSEEVIGRPYEELSGSKNFWLAKILLETLKRGRIYTNYETSLLKEGDLSIPLGVSTYPLRDYTSQAAGAIMVLTDLSSIKELQEKMRRGDRLVSLGTMAAGMAHEIRNPLSSIKTFIQLLPRKFADSDFRDSFSQIVAEEVEKINTLINRLLDFARPKPLKMEPMDIGQAVEEILLLIDNEISGRKIRLRRNVEGNVPEVLADKEQIKQVLLNLVLNSLQAMNEGGELRVGIRPGEKKVAVMIADTGCGIKPEDLSRLFDPFFSTKSSGSGLGLAIVHRIIEEHQGTINVKSEPGRGTEVTMELPATKGTPGIA